MEFDRRRIGPSAARMDSAGVSPPPPLRAQGGARPALRLDVKLAEHLRPEVILRPELRPAHATLERIWLRLAAGCGHPRPPPFAVGEFAIGLVASADGLAPLARPGFAWVEAVELSQAAPHPSGATASVLRALAARQARARPGATQGEAVAFGAAVAFALTAVRVRADEQEACDRAAEALFTAGLAAGDPHAGHPDAHGDAFWAEAAPHLAVVTAHFLPGGTGSALAAADPGSRASAAVGLAAR